MTMPARDQFKAIKTGTVVLYIMI